MWCYHKILNISYKDYVSNEEVCAKFQQAIRPQEDLLTIVMMMMMAHSSQMRIVGKADGQFLHARWWL